MENGDSKLISDDELLIAIDRAIEAFEGDAAVLGAAIGAAMIARRFGWRVLLLMYSIATVKNYAKILGVDFRAVFPEYGDLKNKSRAYAGFEKGKYFWQIVTGNRPGRSPDLVRDDLFSGLT